LLEQFLIDRRLLLSYSSISALIWRSSSVSGSENAASIAFGILIFAP